MNEFVALLTLSCPLRLQSGTRPSLNKPPLKLRQGREDMEDQLLRMRSFAVTPVEMSQFSRDARVHDTMKAAR
jgi:hypothetical protein